MILILILLPAAVAEEKAIMDAMELDALELYASEQGVDILDWIRGAISGEIHLVACLDELAAECGRKLFADIESIGLSLVVPAAVLLTLRMALPSGSTSVRATAFVCRVGCISALATAFVSMRNVAEALIGSLLRCTELLTPVMIAALTLSGSETTAAFVTPMSGMCAGLIQNIYEKWGIAFSSAAAGIAIAGNLGEGVRLKRLHGLLKQVVHWGVGGLLAAFMAMLSIQGRLSAGRDSAAVRTAHYAIENLIPVVGGNVSESLDALLSTAHIVKNAVGTSGLMLIAAVSLVPMGRILGMSLMLKFSSAVCEPLGDDPLTAMTGQFADALEMLLILAAASAVLCGLLVGSCMAAAANLFR